MAKTVAPEKVSRLDREFLENGSKKLTKLFTAIFFLFLLGVGNVWGTPTTIYYETFKKNTGSKTADFSSTYAYDANSTTIISTSWKVSRYETSPSDYDGASGESHLATNTSNATLVFSFGNKSSYSSVVLSFGWKNDAGKGKNRTITCVISGDGGETWSSDILPQHNESEAADCQKWFYTTYNVPAASLSNLKVKFTNTAGNTSRVDDVKLTGTAAATCSAPSAPTNSSVSGTGVTISTSSSSANYDIYYSTSSTTPTTQDPTATISSGNSKAITGLSYGTTYYYWMRQNCGGGSTSSWVAGSPTSFTTTVPDPSGVSAGSLSMTGATISITDANDVNSYDVYCSESSTAPVAGTTPSASGSSKSIAVTGLTAGRTYYYWARAKGPDAKSDWVGGSTFTTLTLSSISVSTAPTKTKYLVGDNFDPTALVITRTFSDKSSDTYTYADHTSDFSFSPETNAALTALNTSVTITYGGQTTSQAINVYTVTVNKVNMSSVAIADAGVSASCSGRTLSQSVGSTNYLFNSWNVSAGGVSVSDNSITGTPTGNVTINAKFHAPITVTWKVGSGAASGSPTGEVKYGTAITALPSTPADNALASCGTNKFMGWSASELTGTGNDAPADLFTTVGGAANLTTNTTYRAVFANQTSGGVTNKKITLTYSDFPNAYSSTESTFDKSDYTFGYGNYRYNSDNGTPTGWCKEQVIQARNKSNEVNGFYNKTEMDVTSVVVYKASPTSNGWTVYQGASSKPTSTTITPSVGDASSISATAYSSGTKTCSGSVDGATETPSTYTITGDNKYFNIVPSGAVYFTKIEINYTEGGGVTNSDYQTGCCTTPGTALSITSSSSVATGGTVTLTSTGGNGGTVTWSVVNGTGTASVAGTTLTAGSVGTVTVKAHQDATGSYCAQDAEQAFTVVSATVNVTGVEVSPTSKAIVPGETFTITPTISPSNATDKSVSWTSSASDKASVSSGTVTGVAAGSATITCTTTDGSKTATTAVTVYGVTMQALDEDGNAIAVGGPGTPSRTGASISPAADAGNYVFKEWAISGASLGSSASTKSNTITNPTGAVTVTAKYYKPRTVKWSVNGNNSYNTGSPTTTVAYNGTISTMPTNPSGLACASTFVAWTDATHNNGQTAKASDSYYGSALYTAAGDFPNITAETTTFYAVFAEEVASGTYSDGTTHQWLGSSGYSDWGGNATYSWLRNDDASLPTFEYTPSYGVKKVVLNVKQTQTAGSNTVAVSVGGTAVGSTETVGSESGTTSFNLSFDHGTSTPLSGKVSIVLTNTSGSGTGKGTFSLNSITLYEGAPDVELTNYVTECDANIVRVTYNANGGTTSCTNTTTNKTEDFTICSSVPTRDYYTFAGWLCSADDEVYAASATIDDAVIDGDFTLTAQWTPLPYDITYELDGGTNSGSNPAIYNVTTSTITLQDPTKGHDRFEGWYGNGSFTGDAITSIPIGSHGDITLYAKWAERHEIIFDADGATTTIYRADDEDLSASVAGQGSVPSDPSAPTACSSKVFVGWSESTIDGETDTEPGDLMKPATGTVDEDKHYYAVWANESSESGTVTVFNDAFQSVSNGSDYQDNKAKPDKYTTNKVYGTGSAGEARMSSSSASGSISIDLSGEDLESTITVSFKLKYWSDSESGSVSLSCMDDGNTASFSNSPFAYPTTSGWKDFSSTVTNVDDKVESITFNSTSGKRVYIKDIVITQTGTIYSYSAYSTNCCATNVTLSQNDPENGTIVFGKTTVGTCGDKEVSLTITPANGYQLHTYSVATGDGKVATKSVSPAISLDNNSNAAQNITLTFADKANGAYDVTASFTEMTVTSWTWTMHDGGGAVPDPLNLYVGQSARLDVAYTPDGVVSGKKTYTREKNDTYINFGGGSYTNYTTISGKASTGENTTAVTFTHADGPTKTVNVKVLPLPLTHFVDLVHGKSFDDVVATISDNALSATKTTPTSDDWTTPNANDCESDHLHLVGWIREDWPALVNYLNGTSDAPATTAIVGAGNDGSGHAYFFTPGASINTQTFNGVTFYAVWAEIK